MVLCWNIASFSGERWESHKTPVPHSGGTAVLVLLSQDVPLEEVGQPQIPSL